MRRAPPRSNPAPLQRPGGSGASDPSYRRKRNLSARATSLNIRIRNRYAGGQAATVAGDVGPGFHPWPSGHILQTPDPQPLLRSRSQAKKTFGETFGEARAATVKSGSAAKTGRLRGQRPQLQKKPTSCCADAVRPTQTGPPLKAKALQAQESSSRSPCW